MGDNTKSTAILFSLLAVAVGYLLWSGQVIKLFGIDGIQSRQAIVAAQADTLATIQAKIDTAKRDLAIESVEDVKARTAEYAKSLDVLRKLVPEQREVANILDDINVRAKVRGLDVSSFVPSSPTVGPDPFDTYSYQFSVIGRYNQVGAFLTDVASLQRIMVPEEIKVVRADPTKSKVFGDTLSMLETQFRLRTYVKATRAAEDSINGT